jgi:hypothetical protein
MKLCEYDWKIHRSHIVRYGYIEHATPYKIGSTPIQAYKELWDEFKCHNSLAEYARDIGDDLLKASQLHFKNWLDNSNATSLMCYARGNKENIDVELIGKYLQMCYSRYKVKGSDEHYANYLFEQGSKDDIRSDYIDLAGRLYKSAWEKTNSPLVLNKYLSILRYEVKYKKNEINRLSPSYGIITTLKISKPVKVVPKKNSDEDN